MDSLKNTKKLVRKALESSVKARNSDNYLYYLICKSVMQSKGVDISGVSFRDGLLNRKLYGLPNYETVRRARQKLQQENPELAGTEEVEAERVLREEAFREFARGC